MSDCTNNRWDKDYISITNQDIAILQTVNEIAKRFSLKPQDFIGAVICESKTDDLYLEVPDMMSDKDLQNADPQRRAQAEKVNKFARFIARDGVITEDIKIKLGNFNHEALNHLDERLHLAPKSRQLS